MRRGTHSLPLRVVAALLLPLMLAACAPMSPETAAVHCEERARLAERPRGKVYAGAVADNRGTRPAFGGELTVSSDWVRGADPHQLYEDCVRARSGQGPIRPLNLG